MRSALYWWLDASLSVSLAENSCYREIERRAFDLLWDWLSLEQRAEVACTGRFTVTGSVSGRHYRISPGTVYNILRVEDDLEVCCVPVVGTRALPVADIMLAQKIALETDETAVLSAANVRRRGPTAGPGVPYPYAMASVL